MQLVIGLRLHLLSPSKCGNSIYRSHLLQISVRRVRALLMLVANEFLVNNPDGPIGIVEKLNG